MLETGFFGFSPSSYLRNLASSCSICQLIFSHNYLIGPEISQGFIDFDPVGCWEYLCSQFHIAGVIDADVLASDGKLEAARS